MLRRLALLVALLVAQLVPTAGLAQIAGQVLVVPAAFGVADCTSTSTYVTIAWTSAVTPVTGDVYRLYVSNVSNGASCSTDTPVGSQLGGDITALTTLGTYPVTGVLTRADFIEAAGITSCPAGGTSSTIYLCVQQVGGTVRRASMTGSVPLELKAPPVPVNVRVAAGDTQLKVSWDSGTDNGVAATSYRATAVAQGNSSDTHTNSTTGKSVWVTGLTNDVTYDVTVTSVSAGSNESAASTPAVAGTPRPVNGFWEQYQADGGQEQGGCGGGPAGVLSLLGVALALRGIRRGS